MTHFTRYQIAAISATSRKLNPANPEAAAAAFVSDDCPTCAEHSYGSCYECQVIEEAVIAATPANRLPANYR